MFPGRHLNHLLRRLNAEHVGIECRNVRTRQTGVLRIRVIGSSAETSCFSGSGGSAAAVVDTLRRELPKAVGRTISEFNLYTCLGRVGCFAVVGAALYVFLG